MCVYMVYIYIIYERETYIYIYISLNKHVHSAAIHSIAASSPRNCTQTCREERHHFMNFIRRSSEINDFYFNQDNDDKPF